MLKNPKAKRKIGSSSTMEPVKKKSMSDKAAKPKTESKVSKLKERGKQDKVGVTPRKYVPKGKKPNAGTSSKNESQMKSQNLSRTDLREQQKAKKERLHKATNANYNITVEMKQIWELLRRHNLDKVKREDLCRKVYVMVKDKETEFAFAHDTSRIFQTLVKYSSKDIRSALFQSLKPSLLIMVQKKHSVCLVRSVLRHGSPNERTEIVDELTKHARKLISHRIAGPLIETLYTEHANEEQKSKFLQQFYGPSYMFLIRRDSEKKDRTLKELFEEEPTKAAMILKFMHDSLEKIIEKATALNFHFVHKIVYEYFVNCSDKERKELADSLQEHIAEIVHTREGSRSACYVVWNSSAKGRKVILKSLKPFLDKLFVENNGHIVLMAIFDSVDDTKIVGKIILTYLKAHWSEIIENLHGRRVVKYLLKPRNQHFAPPLREFLEIGDSNQYSVKHKEKRHAELVDEVADSVMTYAIASCKEMLSKDDLMIFLHLLNAHPQLHEKRSELQSAIATHLPCFLPEYRARSIFKCVESMVYWDQTGEISLAIFNNLTEDHLRTLLNENWGCFFLFHLKSKLPEEEAEQIVELVKSCKDALGQEDSLGAQKLLEACA